MGDSKRRDAIREQMPKMISSVNRGDCISPGDFFYNRGSVTFARICSALMPHDEYENEPLDRIENCIEFDKADYHLALSSKARLIRKDVNCDHYGWVCQDISGTWVAKGIISSVIKFAINKTREDLPESLERDWFYRNDTIEDLAVQHGYIFVKGFDNSFFEIYYSPAFTLSHQKNPLSTDGSWEHYLSDMRGERLKDEFEQRVILKLDTCFDTIQECCESFEVWVEGLLICDSCKSRYRVTWLERSGASSSDRSDVCCPNCQASLGSLYSAGYVEFSEISAQQIYLLSMQCQKDSLLDILQRNGNSHKADLGPLWESKSFS